MSGSQTVAKNQTTGGGAWQLLGTYPFGAGTAGFVRLSDSANGKVLADAVKLEFVGP